MRISKPSTKGGASYEIYQNIALRNQDSEKLEDGQEVKVLDASGDPNIKNGWAIYKFSKESNLFDLLEKQEQPIIPVPTIIDADESSIFKTENKLSVPEAMFAMRTNMRILEDFDFDLSFDGRDMQLTPVGGARTIKIAYDGVVKYLSILNQKLSFSVFDNKGKGKRVHWVVDANVSDTDILSSYMVFTFNDQGSPVLVKPKSSDAQIPIMQVSVLVPADGTAPKAKDFVIHKYWKQALAPAEERIQMPEPATPVDGITIIDKCASSKKLVIPELQHPYYENIKLMKNFSLDATVDVATKEINFTFNGTNAKLSIPVKTKDGIKYLKLVPFSMNQSFFASCLKGSGAFVGVSGYIKNTEEEQVTDMQLTKYDDGSALSLLPRDIVADGLMLVFQVRFDVPLQSFWAWHQRMVTVFKTWEQALAPAEERITIPEAGDEIVTDDYSIYQDVISEKNTLVVPSSYFSTTNDFRILEDFDYTIEQGYQGNSVVFSPVGGARNIPVLVEGVKKYMSINTEGVLFNLFGGSGKGRYNHIEIAATIRDNDDAVSNMTTYYNSGGEILLTKPKSGNTITLFQARIYNPVDVADWDAEKLSIWKYWKKALAPAEERMGVDWYGVSKDMSSEFPVCSRIGNMDLHRSLPVQNKMKRCLLWDNGTIHYYLDPNDSTKKADGTAATLDGSHGQVMVEVPEYYYCYERIGTVCYYKISLSPLEGFKRIKKSYVSAYEASMQRSNSKLSSLINLDPDFRGGINKSSDDANALKTGLGRPVGNELRSILRNAGYNRGDNWHMYHVYNHYMLSMLFVIEYATFNSQLAFNSELDNSGFKQGGLGKGLTDGDSIGHMIAGMTAVVPCGITNSLGNNSGETTYNAIGLAVGTDQELTANSYRGIENPFGHMSKFVDGINSIASHGYVSEARKGLSDDVIEGFEYVGRLGTGNYITDVMDYILPLPKTTSGGSSTTFLCDLTSVNNNNSSVSLGGMLSSLDGSGLFNFQAAISTTPITYAGTRLCFTH